MTSSLPSIQNYHHGQDWALDRLLELPQTCNYCVDMCPLGICSLFFHLKMQSNREWNCSPLGNLSCTSIPHLRWSSCVIVFRSEQAHKTLYHVKPQLTLTCIRVEKTEISRGVGRGAVNCMEKQTTCVKISMWNCNQTTVKPT